MSALHKSLAISRRAWTFLLIVSLITSTIVLSTKPADAADMQMKTGYFLGTGSTVTVTGLGFQPDLVMLKNTPANLGMVFKTSSMAASETAYLSATAHDTGTNLTLTSDGFTVGGGMTTMNINNTLTRWIAYGGSDCTSTGNFCVGNYTGSGGGADRLITTGFQPTVAIVKRSTAIAANYRIASMPTARAEHFSNAAAITNGRLHDSFAATGFNIGRDNNTSGGIFTFIAFKSGSAVAEGSYTGNGTDNRSITSTGFLPNAVFIKNSSSGTAANRIAAFSSKYHFGDASSFIANGTADAGNAVQALEADGFQVGTDPRTNESGAAVYWFAVGNEVAPAASGSFEFEQGAYTGTGTGASVTGLGFVPDLVIIKSDASIGSTVIRTRMMNGNLTGYLGETGAPFVGGITSLDSDGFTLGTNVTVNASGNTYRWQAFGNAYDPINQTGASDFAIGVYLGNATDNRNITGLPFQPDLVFIRSAAVQNPPFRTSTHVGDASSYFRAFAESADDIQQFNSDGFQIGTSANVNTTSTLMYWVAFKAGDNMRVGSYSGNSVDNTYVSTTSFRPDLVWTKSSSATSGVHRPSSIAADATQTFSAAANFAGGVKELNGGGFTLGTSSFANSSLSTYKYVAWRKPLPETLTTAIVDDTTGIPLVNPTINLGPVQAGFVCSQSAGFIGSQPDVVRITNMRMDAAWSTSIAATNGPTTTWLDSGSGRTYDYNDPTESGCGDGGDADTLSGQMTINPSAGFVNPEQFCDTANVTMGSSQGFSQGSVDAITLVSASIGANTACYWDINDVNVTQSVPAEQPSGTYELEMTITTVAS